MLVRGRRLYPRRLLRHLFQELVGPWIQCKRAWLRVVWFFTTPIRIGPMWSASVLAGILGVMLPILLFKPTPRLEASIQPPPAVRPTAQPLLPAVDPTPQPVVEQFFPSQPDTVDFTRFLWTDLFRTRINRAFDQHEQLTLNSVTRPVRTNLNSRVDDRWLAYQRPVNNGLNSNYYQLARRWNPSSFAPVVVAVDQPARYEALETRPALIVSRDLPEQVIPGEPFTYTILVRNDGAEVLEDLIVSELLSDPDQVQAVYPEAEVSDSRLYWRIPSLAPLKEQRFRVTMAAGSSPDLQVLTEVRSIVAVSSSTTIKPEPPSSPVETIPLTENEPPPALMEPPAAEPVKPASREEPPRFARLVVMADIPNSLQTEDELSTVFVVTNTGDADAHEVVLTVQVPLALQHRDGPVVEHKYATIPAGSSKRALFKAICREAGLPTMTAQLSMRAEPVANWKSTLRINARPVPVTPAVTPAPASPGPMTPGPAAPGPNSPDLIGPVVPPNFPRPGQSPAGGNSGPAGDFIDSSIPRRITLPESTAPSRNVPTGPATDDSFLQDLLNPGGAFPPAAPSPSSAPVDSPSSIPGAAGSGFNPFPGSSTPAAPPVKSSIPMAPRSSAPVAQPVPLEAGNPFSGVESSIPSGRSPGLNPSPLPATAPAPMSPPAPMIPPAPGALVPPAQQEEPMDEGNFVSVPKRAGATSVPSWKRTLPR